MVSHRDYATLLALASPGSTPQTGSFLFVSCGRYDTQHNDFKHNVTQRKDTQHNDAQYNDFQHNDAQDNSDENATLSIMAGHCYAECCGAVVWPRRLRQA